jgi:DNA-binding transcriptional regulator LsrR (DeoR family)
LLSSEEVLELRKAQRLEMLAEVCSLYYEHEMTQAEIAEKFFISRSRVSRLLTMAREKGVISFKIQHYGERCFEFEQMFKRKFKLDEVFILNSNGHDEAQMRTLMGEMAASYIHKQLKPRQTVGISWGKSMERTIAALKPAPYLNLEVVQVIGGILVQNPVINIPGLLGTMVEKFGASGIALNAPLLLDSPEACRLIKQQPAIAFALDKARKADLILTGVGGVNEDTLSYLWSGIDTEREFKPLRERGAVGFMCAQAFDINGKTSFPEFNKRVVSLTLEELKSAKKVVSISGGASKGAAMLGALRTGIINVLVTDLACVREIIRLEKQESGGQK